MKRALSLMLLLAVMLVPASSFATDSYSDEVSAKLQSGLTNTLFGWTKVFSVPHQYQAEKKNPWAGVGKGAVDAVHCTVAGAFNLLTFPIPAGMTLRDGCVAFSGLESAPEASAAPADWEGSTKAPDSLIK